MTTARPALPDRRVIGTYRRLERIETPMDGWNPHVSEQPVNNVRAPGLLPTASSVSAKLVKGSDVEAVEQANHDELDRLIERRTQGRTGRDAANERARLLQESVERYNARRREANRWEWVRYFERLSRNHATIAESYERRAQALQEGGS